MAKDKFANLRVTINVDLMSTSEMGIVRSLLRHCNVLAARTKPRWALNEIMKEGGVGPVIKPGDKWADKQTAKAMNDDALIPFPKFDDLNRAAAEHNNRAVMCMHRIYPSTGCSICSRGTVTHSRDVGGPVVVQRRPMIIEPATPYTPRHTPHNYAPYNYEADKAKREATEKALFEARAQIARERRMEITGVSALPELGVEDGVVYDYEMW